MRQVAGSVSAGVRHLLVQRRVRPEIQVRDDGRGVLLCPGQQACRADGRGGDRGGGHPRAVRDRNHGEQAGNAGAAVVADRCVCRRLHHRRRQIARVALHDGDARFKRVAEQPRRVGVRVRRGRPGRDQVGQAAARGRQRRQEQHRGDHRRGPAEDERKPQPDNEIRECLRHECRDYPGSAALGRARVAEKPRVRSG